MALAHGYALPFEALRRTGVLAQNTADATIRATADGATKEAAGSCLDARALEVQQRTVVQPSILVVPQLTRNGVVLNQLPDTRTNFIQNNTMTGATGSVRPNLWDLGSLPSGFTVNYSASGQTTAADGTLVDYIDLTVSGTALASGFLNLRQTTSPSPVSGNLLFASGMTYTASVYLALLSGSLTGVATNAMALQEIANTTFVANTTFAPVTGITSALTRFTGTRPIDATGGADRVSVRWGHSIVSGTSYNYTVRIASPQLEKGSVATPLIRTASGFVTVDMLGAARDGAPPDFTFTRATTATRVNASGLIESVASGLLRLDYPVTGGCPAALIEPSAQNLALQSEDFTTTWSPTNVTVSANVTGTTDPFGTNLADQIFETAASGLHFLAQTMSITSGTTYTGTIFFKKATGSPDWVQLAFSTTGLAGFANFNLASGTVGNVLAGCTASIENYGNGWYRCRLTQTATASGTSGGPIPVFVNNTNSVTRFLTYTGNTATSIYVFGAQLETGAIPTSYIPTTAASATRAADVCSVSGVSGYIGQTEGTIYAEVDIRNMAKETYTLEVDDGVNANRIIIRSLTSNQMRGSIVATTSSGTIGISSATFTSGIVKIAFAYKSGDFALSVNGAAALTASGTFTFGASLNRITLGSVGGGGIQLNDRIRAAAIYKTRLPNDVLAVMTNPVDYATFEEMTWAQFVAKSSTYTELPACLETRHNQIIIV